MDSTHFLPSRLISMEFTSSGPKLEFEIQIQFDFDSIDWG
jgi:hypothetical protein